MRREGGPVSSTGNRDPVVQPDVGSKTVYEDLLRDTRGCRRETELRPVIHTGTPDIKALCHSPTPHCGSGDAVAVTMRVQVQPLDRCRLMREERDSVAQRRTIGRSNRESCRHARAQVIIQL